MFSKAWAVRGHLSVLGSALQQHLAFEWRGSRRSPGFSLAVVIVLALGLGANAALFSLLDSVFLATPTGVDAPAEIRRLY
jgi:putative ABC transport system permease protein